MQTKPILLRYLSVFALGVLNPVHAQNLPSAHWVNGAGQNAATTLNTNVVFITDFKAHDDLKVTRLTTNSYVLYTGTNGGATPGNNPAYITSFVGMTNNGTGDGIAGDIQCLDMANEATGSLQFDFLYPLTPHDRILMIDVDGLEQWQLLAYTITGSSTSLVSFAGWRAEDFSGMTGIIPDARWPVWDWANGIVSGGGSGINLRSELFVLTPAQNIDRLIITKLGVFNWRAALTFLSVQTPLAIQNGITNVVLTWTNAAFGLQSAPAVTGTYTNIPNAVSPYTNDTIAPQLFFRTVPK
jgi:hypothetical protein